MKTHPKTQQDKFKEAARELECYEDEKRFNTVKKLAKSGGKKDDLTKQPNYPSPESGDG